MKLIVLVSILAASATAFPTSMGLFNRSVATEACNIGYCMENGGTTGGAGGKTTTVTSLSALKAAAGASGPAIIIVKGAIKGNEVVKVTSDKTILGAAGSSMTGVGLRINGVRNVIVRNMKISKVLADAGDAVAVQKSENVWIDHMDLSSDKTHGKDYYDGLCDVTHAANYVTISNTFFHDHFKATLVGHSDSNAKEDTGNLIVTYANNRFKNVNSRGPSFRFGTGHVFNSLMEGMDTAVNTRMGAQLLVESNFFTGVSKPIESADSSTPGFAVLHDNDLGAGQNSAKSGKLESVPYEYTLLGSDHVEAAVTAEAGQTLTV
ncbi:unnamed protein product [Discula destructiva]